MARQLSEMVILITGASAGIGEAVARRFAAGGFRIVAVARRQDRLEQLAGALSDQSSARTRTDEHTPRMGTRCADVAHARRPANRNSVNPAHPLHGILSHDV